MNNNFKFRFDNKKDYSSIAVVTVRSQFDYKYAKSMIKYTIQHSIYTISQA